MALAICFDAGSCEEERNNLINTRVTGGCAKLSASLELALGCGKFAQDYDTIVPTVSNCDSSMEKKAMRRCDNILAAVWNNHD